MKSPPLGNPKRDLQAGDAVTLERQRILQRAVDELYFSATIAADRATYEGGTASVKNTGFWTIEYPNAVTSRAHDNVPTRALWVRTRPRVTVWYTSPTLGTANFDFQFVLRVTGPGSNAMGAVNSFTWSAPGPAAANDILVTSAIASFVHPSSPYGVTQVRLDRLGAADANNNALQVLLALVTFEEVA